MRGVVHLILLPGLDGTEVFFRPLIEALPDWIHCRVVTYPNTVDSGYASLLPRVEAAAAGLESYIVLGWSFGGPLAVQVAARDVQRVRGLILCSTFLRRPRPRYLEPFAVAPLVGALRALRRLRLLRPDAASNGLRRAKAETWKRVGSSALAARARAALTVDVRASLQACRAPVLYLAAEDDRVIDAAHGWHVLESAAQAERDVIPGPHLALFTHPEPAARRIEKFITLRSSSAESIRS